MELLMMYRKVAKRSSWLYVITHFIKIGAELEAIQFLSEKFGVMYLYERWIEHPYLAVPYPRIISMVAEYHAGRGKNYQIELKRIFGAQ
jgi:hypothetical protein